MASREKWLKNSKLYVILDAQVNDYDRLFEIARIAIRNGVDILQVRDKLGRARDILKLTGRILKLTSRRVPVIVNDRVDLAMACGADGVHLGQDDIPVKIARKMMGRRPFIGVSCQTLAAALNAERDGADYIGFGSVFETLTKPERSPMALSLLARVYKIINIPVFAIGGIHLGNMDRLVSIGVNRLAVCRAVCEEQDIAEAVLGFNGRLSREVSRSP